MNREIKFRGWLKPRWEEDEDANKMYYDIQNSYDTLGDVKPYDPMTDFREWIDDDIAVVEQYTGLKDKNDKEIYEGDIIEDTRGNIWECSWSDISSGWSFRRKFMSEDDFMASDDISEDWLERSEIIGNIHENPELLEEGK